MVKGISSRNFVLRQRRSDQVLLGPDPDREGEAIAWHLMNALGISEDEKCRIEFSEITKKALKEAVKKPRQLDKGRIEAQQGRRILDRLVGYKLSPLLWRKVKKGLSAGRVQSVAVRLICEREQEIRDFQPEEYWSITGYFKAENGSLEAKLVRKGEDKIALATKDDVAKVLEELGGVSFNVSKVTKRERKRNPAPPFITSTLQQEASRSQISLLKKL